MTQREQHRVVYNIPSGAEGGFNRVEVLAPLGMSVLALREAVAAFLHQNPGAILLSRTWSDRDL